MIVRKYAFRHCPRCNEYIELALPALRRELPVYAINGQCSNCYYRLFWQVIVSALPPRRRRPKALPLKYFGAGQLKTVLNSVLWIFLPAHGPYAGVLLGYAADEYYFRPRLHARSVLIRQHDSMKITQCNLSRLKP